MSPTRHVRITALEKDRLSSLTDYEKLAAVLTTEPSILGPLNNSRASIITSLTQFLPASTKLKGFIWDISNISEKQILQTPADGNLNHRVENPTFDPIKPHKPQVFLNPCLLRHPHSFLCFLQSGRSLLLQKSNSNYLDWYKDLAENVRRQLAQKNPLSLGLWSAHVLREYVFAQLGVFILKSSE